MLLNVDRLCAHEFSTVLDHNARMKALPFSRRLARNGPTASSGQSAAAPRWAAAVLWLAAGLSGGYWLLQSIGREAWVPVPSLSSSVPQADTATVARALGAAAVIAETPAAAPAETRYRLWGVVSQRAGRSGAALIAVGAEPPRPFRVGDAVGEGLVLQSVAHGVARLGAAAQGASSVELTLPAAPAAGP